jgi:hypothetical protein
MAYLRIHTAAASQWQEFIRSIGLGMASVLAASVTGELDDTVGQWPHFTDIRKNTDLWRIEKVILYLTRFILFKA